MSGARVFVLSFCASSRYSGILQIDRRIVHVLICIFILHLVLSSRCANCRLHGPEECWYRMTKENAHRPSNYMSSPPKNALCSYSHHSNRIKRSTIQYSTSTAHNSPANENNWGSSSTFCPYCTVYLCGAQAKYTVPFHLLRDERTRQGSGGRVSKTSSARAGLFPSRRVCSKRGLFLGDALPRPQ